MAGHIFHVHTHTPIPGVVVWKWRRRSGVLRTRPSTYFSGQRGRKELVRRGRVSSRSPTLAPGRHLRAHRCVTHVHTLEEPHYGATVARGCAAKEASVN